MKLRKWDLHGDYLLKAMATLSCFAVISGCEHNVSMSPLSSDAASETSGSDALSRRRPNPNPSPSATVTPSPSPSPSPSPDAGYAFYQVYFDGANRTFNFDGNIPFVNPNTNSSDLAGWIYNAIEQSYYDITNAGVPPWIQKVSDGGVQVDRFQVFPTDNQIYNWRTHTNSFGFENYKQYIIEMEFKLDPSWDLNMGSIGDGLFWQTKSNKPKPNQYGNAVMGLNLTGDTLYYSVLYPTSAMNATTWPTSVTWGSGQYVKTNFPTRTIVTGRYYKVRIEFFADDRPPQFGGQGFANVWLDDQLWIQYSGPTIHPDQAGPHRWDFGWYNWGGQPTSTRTVYFKTFHVYAK